MACNPLALSACSTEPTCGFSTMRLKECWARHPQVLLRLRSPTAGHVCADGGVLRRAKQRVPATPPSTPAAGMASADRWDTPPLRETVTSVTKEVPNVCAKP